jgi:hypothetical protein
MRTKSGLLYELSHTKNTKILSLDTIIRSL